MWNIMKALHYQLKRDNAVIYIYCGSLLLLIGLMADYMINNGFGGLTGSEYAIVGGANYLIILGMLINLLTARIVGWDYTDKTLNYEVMAGHSRRDVFFGRVLVSMFWCGISYLMITFVPILLCSLINGWGETMKMGDVLLRYTLAIFPVFRMVCITVLLTVLLRNDKMSMIISYIAFEFSWLIATMAEHLIDFTFTTQLSACNIYRMLYLDKFHFAYIDGVDVIVYETAIVPEFALGTVLVSLLVCVITLGIAYWYFIKSDMD